MVVFRNLDLKFLPGGFDPTGHFRESTRMTWCWDFTCADCVPAWVLIRRSHGFPNRNRSRSSGHLLRCSVHGSPTGARRS